MRTDERGSAAVELAVLAPALVALLFVVVIAGRMTSADGAVRRAAGDAARAASLERSAPAARAAAVASIADNLSEGTLRCTPADATVDTDAFGPGGTVAVSVTCRVELADVALLAVPGARTFQARAVEVVDRYRSS